MKEDSNFNDNFKISITAALFKVCTNTVMDKDLTAVLFKDYSASPLIIEKEYTIFEVLGSEDKMHTLKLYLKDNGLIEYIMSNKIAL
jgi:acetolactate synthase-1/3 small subunit